MGYLNMPEKTEEALDSEGWLHSGDLGKQDQDGFLFITGRIKGVVPIRFYLISPFRSEAVLTSCLWD